MIKIESEVSKEKIESMLCNALEGGSNYWYFLPDLEMLKDTKSPYLVDKIVEYVLANPDGKVPVYDLEDEEEHLGDITLENIKRGTQLLAVKDPKAYANMMEDNADAGDGDVWLQYVVMGKIIYG
jgi:hypothetical protein